MKHRKTGKLLGRSRVEAIAAHGHHPTGLVLWPVSHFGVDTDSNSYFPISRIQRPVLSHVQQGWKDFTVSGDHGLVTLPMRKYDLSLLCRGPRTPSVLSGWVAYLRGMSTLPRFSCWGRTMDPPCTIHKELPNSKIQKSGQC